MINSNKRWLLTASPWMNRSLRLSPLVTVGMFFIALLVFNFETSKAQVGPVKTSKGGPTHTMALPVTTGTMTTTMPVITGSTTTTCVGTHITLTNALAGGTWSASNGNVTLTP